MSSYIGGRVTYSTNTKVPPYTLPESNGLQTEDDWTAVKDRKLKKKIQNRVAQRAYRQRMKSRLAEVQDKLQHLEQESQDQGTESENRRAGSQDRTRSQDGETITPPTKPDSFMSKTQDTELMEQRVFSSDPFAQGGEGNKRSLTMQNSMQLLSPVTSQSQSSEGETVKMYERLILNQLNVPKYVLEKLISEQENSFLQPSNAAQNRMRSFSDGAKDTTLMPPEMSDKMETLLNTPVEYWRPDKSSLGMPLSYQGTVKDASLAHMSDSSTDSMFRMQEPQMMLLRDASLNDRFEKILDCTEAAGFENFDALVTSYYNASKEDFDESSYLANEQRLSRSRRLPKVIADVFEGAKNWSVLESRGFHEEILKTTELMLASERASMRNPLNFSISPYSRTEANNTSAWTSTVSSSKMTIQNELPNLLALMMSVASDNRAIGQRDRSNVAYAAILLLHCGGRIPNDQLLDMLRSCL
ncbi:hypothetical protein BGZ60DRAFT_419837 [Tricladium varicosporioides]|nr:hypothetical protein BGZ60DRAFT_419837 [Hymenoscyphus varicosporioides]